MGAVFYLIFYSLIIIGTIVLSSYMEADYAMKMGIIVFVISAFFTCFGFCSKGINAKSGASSWQSCIGVVVAGSLFAILQCLGMIRAFEVGMICGVFLFLGGLCNLEVIRIEIIDFFDSLLNKTSTQFNTTYSAINATVSNEIDKFLNSTASNFAVKVFNFIGHN